MTPHTNGDPAEYYESRRSKARRVQKRRFDRRAQAGAVLLAAAVGVAAGMHGTHRSWEHPAPEPSSVVHPSSTFRP